MSLKSPDAAADRLHDTAGHLVVIPGSGKLPHLDGLVQATADEVTRVGRESNRVNTVLVALGTLETLQQEACLDIPDPDTLVKRAGGDILGIGRDGNGGDAVLDGERCRVQTSLNIPKPDSAIATARSNGAAITGKIQAVDILLVTSESVANLPVLDVPDSDELVFSTGSQVLPVWTEANASDIKIAVEINTLVLENADLVTSLNIVDLSRSVASRRDKFAIGAEPHAADHTLVLESVNQINIQNTGHRLVENGPPIVLDLLDVAWETLGVQVAQCVALRRNRDGLVLLLLLLHHASVVGGGMGRDLGRLAGAVVGNRSVDLGGGGTAGRGSPDRLASLAAGAGASGALGGLRWKTAGGWSLVLLLERGLLRRRGRRGRRSLLESRWRGGHVGRLLLLLRRMRRGGQAALSTLPGEDPVEDTTSPHVAYLRRGLLGRASMLWRRVHRSRGATAASFQLTTKEVDFILVSEQARAALEGLCSLSKTCFKLTFASVGHAAAPSDKPSRESFASLEPGPGLWRKDCQYCRDGTMHGGVVEPKLTLVFISLDLSLMRFKLGADALQELVLAAAIGVGRGRDAHAAMAGIHRHCVQWATMMSGWIGLMGGRCTREFTNLRVDKSLGEKWVHVARLRRRLGRGL